MYDTVASFNVLMQSFYGLQQPNEGVAAFITRMEGALSSIRMKHPARILEHETRDHLCDRFFPWATQVPLQQLEVYLQKTKCLIWRLNGGGL